MNLFCITQQEFVKNNEYILFFRDIARMWV